MARIRLNVKTEITKALEDQGKQIVNLVGKDLDKISKRALEVAEEELKKAEYDGDPNDAIIYRDVSERGKTWTITLSGPAAMAIEYGAGNKSDYWFFSGKGKKVQLTAGGAHARYRRYLREDASFYNVFNEDKQRMVRRVLEKYDDPVWHYDAAGKRRLNPIREIPNGGNKVVTARKGGSLQVPSRVPGRDPVKFHQYVPTNDYKGNPTRDGVGYQFAEKKNSYITMGNPPNNIMKKVFEQMVDEVEKLTK